MDPLRELGTLALRHARDRAVAIDTHPSLGLRFSVARHAPQLSHHVYDPSFGVVVQGQKQIALGDQRFTCAAGTFLVITVDLPLAIEISQATPDEPFIAMAMCLKPASVATLLLEAADASGIPAEAAGLGVSDAPPELLEACVRLVRLLDQPRDIAVLGPLVEREILWRLLCSEQGYRLRQIGLADSRLSQIARAMRWIREHYREALRIDDLARRSAMSTTSLHRHFRAVALMSPLQYQKQIRLHVARAQLLAGADDIASVGHDVGYDSSSQFSREYKRAYGAPPGEDARQLRAAARAPMARIQQRSTGG